MISFFEHLKKSRDRVSQAWMTAIQASPAFSTPAKTSLKVLMNHMPEVYDDMIAYLEGGFESPKDRSTSDRHATQRWTNHFCVSDLVREILLLRNVVSRELDTFQTISSEPLNERAEMIVRGRLSLYFDEAIIDSVRQYTGEQQAYTDEHSRVLSARTKAAESTADDFQKKDEERLRLLRVIAHELRNFLNAASLITQSLREEDNDAARKEMEATLDRNHQQMGSLLNHLLEAAPILSGLESIKLAHVNLAAFARQEALSLQPLANSKNLQFQHQVADDMKEVVSDEAKLRRVVINLVQNAIKYTDKGTVTLTIRRHDKSQWELRVSDTGPGIPPEQYTKIFEEFHRLPGSELREGAGLGLAIVKHLVRVMGGQIRVESAIGQGTSFSVTLPFDIVASAATTGKV